MLSCGGTEVELASPGFLSPHSIGLPHLPLHSSSAADTSSLQFWSPLYAQLNEKPISSYTGWK